MLFLRFFLFVISSVFVLAAVILVTYDIFLIFQVGRWLKPKESPAGKLEEEHTAGAPDSPQAVIAPAAVNAQLRIERSRRAVRWAAPAKLVVAAALCALAASSVLVVPDGNAAVRISQIFGVRAGTLCAGTHFIFPLRDRVELYDIREKVFSSAATESSHEKLEVL